MTQQRYDFYNITDACRHNEPLRTVVDTLQRSLTVDALTYPDLLTLLEQYNMKNFQEFSTHQYQQSMIIRNSLRDRIFPLDTVEIKQFNTDHQADIENALIHIGPAADEFTRSMDALAITVAMNIYFRSNTYNPSTEEGRALLAHELTHVKQHTEGRITPQSSKTQLEQEAEQEEQKAIYDSDPCVRLRIRNKIYKLRRSQMKTLVKLTADEVEQHVLEQKHIMSEQEYLNFLCTYEQWLEGGFDA